MPSEMVVEMSERPGEMDRFAIDCALRAAWMTELWIPGDPDFRYTDYFEAAAARNIGLLHGFEELAEDIEKRGILPREGSDQARLVTDGGKQLGVLCDVESCDNRIVGLDDGWEYSRGTVCQDCIDYQDRHGHWPDEDAEICVQCRIDDGAIEHDCDEFSGDAVLLQPGDSCDYCGFEAAKEGEQDG